MSNRYATQGACIVSALLRKGHTHAQMQALGLSTSPHKRVMEYLSRHPEYVLQKDTRWMCGTGKSLIVWRVHKVHT